MGLWVQSESSFPRMKAPTADSQSLSKDAVPRCRCHQVQCLIVERRRAASSLNLKTSREVKMSRTWQFAKRISVLETLHRVWKSILRPVDSTKQPEHTCCMRDPPYSPPRVPYRWTRAFGKSHFAIEGEFFNDEICSADGCRCYGVSLRVTNYS